MANDSFTIHLLENKKCNIKIIVVLLKVKLFNALQGKTQGKKYKTKSNCKPRFRLSDTHQHMWHARAWKTEYVIQLLQFIYV